MISFILYCCVSFLLISSSFPKASAATDGNQSDYLALLAFKSEITHDPTMALSSWSSSVHFCKWEGVTCSPNHQRVTILDLSSRSLVGRISPTIGNMSFLRQIILFNNTFQGEIPQEIGRLFRLQVLDLQGNSISGEIPSNISRCFNLTLLRVGSNRMVGDIPNELSSLYKLQTFSVGINNCSGEIPSFLGNFTSLEVLSLARNQLTGRIPDVLGRLKRLTFLALGGNKLFGTVPFSLYNLSSLTIFSLAGNQLQGTLPSELFFALPLLEVIQFYQNNFSGPIPLSISNASNLQSIDMSENIFSGKMSADLGGLQQLTFFAFVKNNLGSGDFDEMNFVVSLANCSNLVTVQLQFNQFGGKLPTFLQHNLSTEMQFFSLKGNKISGAIPSSIGYLVKLNHLDLSQNRFTGTVPLGIGNIPNLRRLNLHANRLVGEIPASIGNLSSLIILGLAENQLEGPLPSSLGNLQQLTILDLSTNNLSGSIPEQIFSIPTLSIFLDLSENKLSGSLPHAVGNLSRLEYLFISENKLSGEIPSELGQCLGLVNLSLAGNYFHGSIPLSLSSLRGVEDIDLSRNNLSGQIPRYLENFALKTLNLSFNDFEGEVPTKGVFKNVAGVSVSGNQRLCGGIFELKLAKCKPRVANKKKTPRTLLVIIVPIASVLGGIVIIALLCYWFLNAKKVKLLQAFTKQPLLKVSYQDLLAATDGFSSLNLMGTGSFGSVYKGILNETTVAVKVFDLQRRGASKSFLAECEALKNIRHRNLVKIITSCSSIDYQGNEFRALIYEFMPSGNLDSWLHQSSVSEHVRVQIESLDLLSRINIGIDVASAIDYIHHQCETPIIHCDLKPANILLDVDMVAHVGDFGLAKFMPEIPADGSQTSSIGVRGTVGYAAPEYGVGNEPSTYGDVYSYGIVLLEMVTGKRPTDDLFVGGVDLHNFVMASLPDRVMEIVEPSLMGGSLSEIQPANNEDASSSRSLKCLMSLAKVGVACTVEASHDRWKMTQVVRELHSIRDTFSS